MYVSQVNDGHQPAIKRRGKFYSLHFAIKMAALMRFQQVKAEIKKRTMIKDEEL